MKFSLKGLLFAILIFGAAFYFAQSTVAQLVAGLGLAGQIATFLTGGIVGTIGFFVGKWLKIIS